MEEISLNKNEVLDDLQLNNLKIVQNKTNYRFSSDSVLLSNFAKCGSKDNVVEFCSGSGVISILLNEKCHPKTIVGFEIQKELYDMSVKSLKYNGIKNISFVNEPLNLAGTKITQGSIDVIICNPPYYEVDPHKQINPKYKITKYETSTNLDDIFKTANQILKYGGKFYMVHIPERLQQILTTASKYLFQCKKINFVYPSQTKNLSHLVLLMFTKGGNRGLEVPKPIILE